MGFFNAEYRTDSPMEQLVQCDTVGKGLTHLLVRLKDWTYVPEPNQYGKYDCKYISDKSKTVTIEVKNHTNMYANLVRKQDTWIYKRLGDNIADWYAIWCRIPYTDNEWICASVRGSNVRTSPIHQTCTGNATIEESQYMVPFVKIDKVFKLVIAGNNISRYLYKEGIEWNDLELQGQGKLDELLQDLEIASEFLKLIGASKC